MRLPLRRLLLLLAVESLLLLWLWFGEVLCSAPCCWGFEYIGIYRGIQGLNCGIKYKFRLIKLFVESLTACEMHSIESKIYTFLILLNGSQPPKLSVRYLHARSNRNS